MKKVLSVSFAALILLTLTQCATEPKTIESLLPVGVDYETVAIVGTNDIHGAIVPLSLKTRDAAGVPSTSYEAAGIGVLATYIRRLRNEFGDHLIWLDAGDQFQGSLESNTTRGGPMVAFFNLMGLSASAIGNHEFDFGVPNLEARMKEAHYPYLDANILDKKSGKVVNFPNSHPHFVVQTGHLKVGIIGLSTVETPTTTRPDNVKNYRFASLKATTLREAEELRQEGANIIVVVAHAGLFCDLSRQPENRIRSVTDIQGDCDPKKGEIVDLLNALPHGTVDAVVSGHTHTVVHHWINGVPVIQGGVSGKNMNVIYLTYDLAKRHLMTDQTHIEGPIPICESVFQNRKDCNGDVQDTQRGPLVPAIFRGEPVHADAEVQALIKPVVDRTAEIKKEVLAEAARPVEVKREGESEMGNLMSDAVRAATGADVAILNSGGVRAPWEAGPITYGAVYRTSPFDNYIVVLKLKGKDLKTLLRIVESGSKGVSPTSGLRMKLLPFDSKAPSDDLNGNGKIEPWKYNRIVDLKLSNGEPIQDSKTYRVATIDFLVAGGDDWGWIMSRLKGQQLGEKSSILERDALLQYLKKQKGPINSEKHPLIDPKHPRVEFVSKSSEEASTEASE
jgi:5'-nucleotidase